MKKLTLLFSLIFATTIGVAQDNTTVKGTIIRAENGKPLENVNIVNLTKVIGTSTNGKGEFEIRATLNDTIHLSYLGYKSLKVRVTNDWIKLGTSTSIEMTELALALEKVVVNQLRLTGYLAVDIEQVPLQQNFRYSISGLPSTGFEAAGSNNVVTKVLGALFNPADFLHKMFGRKPNELRKLRQMKKDDEIRNILSNRFDREMLTALLQVDKVDLDLLISECNYSKEVRRTANDLQILDAISECYEEYKVLSRKRTRL